MCCERLQESALEAGKKIPYGQPDKDKISLVTAQIVFECPKQTHTATLAGIPKKPESEVIPAFFRRHPQATDLLEEVGALEPLLR